MYSKHYRFADTENIFSFLIRAGFFWYLQLFMLSYWFFNFQETKILFLSLYFLCCMGVCEDVHVSER